MSCEKGHGPRVVIAAIAEATGRQITGQQWHEIKKMAGEQVSPNGKPWHTRRENISLGFENAVMEYLGKRIAGEPANHEYEEFMADTIRKGLTGAGDSKFTGGVFSTTLLIARDGVDETIAEADRRIAENRAREIETRKSEAKLEAEKRKAKIAMENDVLFGRVQPEYESGLVKPYADPIADEFLKSTGKKWGDLRKYTPVKFVGLCEAINGDFARHLHNKGEDVTLVDYVGLGDGDAPAGYAHSVCVSNGLVYDFTHRQVNPTSPIPTIVPVAEWEEKWRPLVTRTPDELGFTETK